MPAAGSSSEAPDRSLQEIASWAAGLRFEAVPPEAVALVRLAFLDTIAVSLSGTRLEAPRIVARMVAGQAPGGEASLIGFGAKASASGAALVNGTAAHADLFDDNSAPMIAHPSAPLVSALLPLAEARGLSGQAVVAAYVAGFETNVRLGRRLNPGLYEAGWHVTRTLGVLGASAAAARLIGLDEARIGHAVGIAASMASGLRQAFGTMTMALHVGLTARDAVEAALLAEAGLGADADALGGKYGYYRLFGGKRPGALDLGRPYELIQSGIIFKPYPSGAPSHAAVDAALALRQRIGGRTDHIARIECLVHPWNAMTLRDGVPRDPLRAKVSLAFCVACALHHGALGPRQFEQAVVDDPAIHALMQKVAIRTAPDLPDNNLFPAEVRLVLDDGREFVERREAPLGSPPNPLGEAGILAKLRNCAEGVITPEASEAIIDQVRRLESLGDVRELCRLLSGAPSHRVA